MAKKIHTDQRGREFIKETYFIGGKMKVRKVYMIDGIPEEEFYERNATDIEHKINGDYWLISYEKEANSCLDDAKQESNVSDDKIEDLPF